MQLTYNKIAVIVFVVLVIGVIVAIWTPLWLAPPVLFYTPILYQCGALLWFPVLLVGLLNRPTGNKVFIILAGVISGVVSLYSVANLILTAAAITSPAFQTLNYCVQDNSNAHSIVYVCTVAGSSDGPYVVRFAGTKGSPFVRVTNP